MIELTVIAFGISGIKTEGDNLILDIRYCDYYMLSATFPELLVGLSERGVMEGVGISNFSAN